MTPGDEAPRRGMVSITAVSQRLRGLVGVVLLALVVQLLATWGPSAWRVPSLPQLWNQVHRFVIEEPMFVTALLHTLRVVLLSLLVAVAAGLIAGLTLGLGKSVYRALALPLELLRPFPAIAVIPVMILAFGQGARMEIAVTALAAWWPILLNTLYGVRNVESLTLETARAFGLRRVGITLRVVLPATLPMVVTGLRIAAPLALIVAVGAEYLATAGQGLGRVLITATSTGDLQVLWAAAVITGVMGIALGGLTWLVGRAACPWSSSW